MTSLLATNTSSSWTPPPPASMRIDDCNATTGWVAAKTLGPHRYAWQDSELDAGVAFLASTVPDDWGWGRPTPAQLATWYIEVWNATTTPTRADADAELDSAWYRTWDLAFRGCGGLICEKLGWRGDPDVTGIGVSDLITD
ncbi:hypothetical protein F4779DRAFT_639394 [Xylariaceae sp. FL0662B]|nr:hypothetical protein F4779DRAFT_639394 [Xylariaceae sp. FL0662B]